MKPFSAKYPLVKLPDETQLCLFLIREELKCRKLFHALHKLGIDDCHFLPHLDDLIVTMMELDQSDESFHACSEVLDRRSKKIQPGKTVMKQAMKAYQELLEQKKSTKQKGLRH